jgi:hypothetical protein
MVRLLDFAIVQSEVGGKSYFCEVLFLFRLSKSFMPDFIC